MSREKQGGIGDNRNIKYKDHQLTCLQLTQPVLSSNYVWHSQPGIMNACQILLRGTGHRARRHLGQRPGPGACARDGQGHPGDFRQEVQEILEKIRKTIREAAPEAQERINYQIPTFTLEGNLVHFAAYRKHIGF
jgi:hypothetical protein